jgi:hypothetical protein
VIAFRLSVSYLEEHHEPMFVANSGRKGDQYQRVDGAPGWEAQIYISAMAV